MLDEKSSLEVSGEAMLSTTSATMSNWLAELLQPLQGNPVIYSAVVGGSLLILLWLVHLFLRFVVIRPLVGSRIFNWSRWIDVKDLVDTKVLSSISTLLSLGFIAILIQILPRLNTGFTEIAERLVMALAVFSTAQLLARCGRLLDVIYSRFPSINRPGALRGYVSVASFVIYLGGMILIVSVLMDKSPIYFLTGLGAISAILLILFRDTLLSIFANVIVTTGDLVRLGDWIHVPGSNADGYVIDISLNVVKVQNFDKTITVLPTYTLVQESFVNYRGMYDSGGRRIKRSILLDQRTIRPLTGDEVVELSKIPLMDQALSLEKTAVGESAAGDRISNSGLFRQYVVAYLRAHPRILGDKFTMLVRHLDPTPEGLPLQIYCFVNDTAWASYEAAQATIFDHLITMVPAFGLRVYQTESDFQETASTTALPAIDAEMLARGIGTSAED